MEANSTYKANITYVETSKNREVNLKTVKVSLKRALRDFESDKQTRLQDVHFDVFNYLQENLGEGFAEPTVRKWENINNNSFAQPQQLLLICKLIGSRKPINALIEYLDVMAE